MLAAITAAWLISGCNSTGNNSGSSEGAVPVKEQESKYTSTYEDLQLYAAPMPETAYRLKSIDDSRFNALPESQRHLVADKLLGTFYFGMEPAVLDDMIASGNFISSVKEMLSTERNDLTAAEARLNDTDDEGEFRFSDWPSGAAEVAKILARFYVLPELDKSYMQYWSAYVLSSTIMFSPAYELESSHNPNIDRIYGALVRAQREEYTIGYTVFLHMISDDNWRRFRSPEDNGREMMEIFLKDFDDTHVPLAGKALQNWHLDRDNDTLVVGLNENRDPVSLFGTTVCNGYDFYRELVNASDFMSAVTGRLVDVFFPTFDAAQKRSVVNTLVSSHPKSWQDLLLQIVFSEKYLFESEKPKSAEELFFSLSKKLHFKHKRGFFSYMAGDLNDMNQAAMKYKLGKPVEVPLDSQSFITYHKAIREGVMIRYKTEWSGGWESEVLLPDTLFEGLSAYEHRQIVDRLVDYLFMTTVSRHADADELAFFEKKMIDEDGIYAYPYRIFKDNGDSNERRNAAIAVMDYLSRLTELYRYQGVEK